MTILKAFTVVLPLLAAWSEPEANQGQHRPTLLAYFYYGAIFMAQKTTGECHAAVLVLIYFGGLKAQIKLCFFIPSRYNV